MTKPVPNPDKHTKDLTDRGLHVLGDTWHAKGFRVAQLGVDTVRFISIPRKLQVLTEVKTKEDGQQWLHVTLMKLIAIPRPGQVSTIPYAIPTWDDITYTRGVFIGLRRKALVVLPKLDKDHRPNYGCVSLWVCLGKDQLPELSDVVVEVITK